MSAIISTIGTLGLGGLIATGTTLLVQGQRERTKITVALIDSFSSLEAHKLRRGFWTVVLDQDANSLDAIGGVADEERRFAALYVVGFFTTAGTLMSQGLLNNALFFALSERWLREILDKHLVPMCQATDPNGPYMVQRHAITSLADRWRAFAPSPRRHVKPFARV